MRCIEAAFRQCWFERRSNLECTIGNLASAITKPPIWFRDTGRNEVFSATSSLLTPYILGCWEGPLQIAKTRKCESAKQTEEWWTSDEVPLETGLPRSFCVVQFATL
ncbi:MAG: hypothetical protein DCC68_24735 [Planctomycetota bacterium]|nr:MAG: hypothetical protein DCC68_24735 [Planctomycetota bacterium]